MRTDDISVRIFFRVQRPDNYRDPTRRKGMNTSCNCAVAKAV